MQTWMAVVQVALLVLGVPLCAGAVVLALFAGGEGSPAGQHLLVTLMAVPVVYLMCLLVSVWLFARERYGHALMAAVIPFLYFMLAFVAAAVWTGLTSS
ncbi:hypothetical protein [Deinococcus marmoris]|uniref:hypothetical protein n=1 Tax=Deinococcus marmoris TaxID=249408 RepID=UPI00096A2A12|nr:hypothetical protein [Deinococcus marmoris]